MTQKEIFLLQIQQVHRWTLKLIDGVTDEKWLFTPSIIDSNIHWQVGHLVITHFYHIIVLLKGPKPGVFGSIPIIDYYPLFSAGSTPKNESKISVGNLKEMLLKIQDQEIRSIQELEENDFNEPLFPTQFPHPVANTKFEAICWEIEHTMWHCGQIAVIKRVVDKRFVFEN
ncbi:MAG: DinB family protein [Bacteroidota bacterium]|nr:DinB family protein [Bacteroidota bacterium]